MIRNMFNDMETFELYSLINQKRWTEFLGVLPIGSHTIAFPSLADIKSCKAVAYAINSDKSGRRYKFNVDKDERRVNITVEAM